MSSLPKVNWQRDAKEENDSAAERLGNLNDQLNQLQSSTASAQAAAIRNETYLTNLKISNRNKELELTLRNLMTEDQKKSELEQNYTSKKQRNEEELNRLKQENTQSLYDAQKKINSLQDNINKASSKKEAKKYKKQLKDEQNYLKQKTKLNEQEEAALQKKQDKNDKEELKKQKEALQQTYNAAISNAGGNLFSGKTTIGTKISAVSSLYNEEGGGAKGFLAVADTIVSGLSTLATKLDSQIDEIAGYQTKIDTRLRGYTAGGSDQVTYEGDNGLASILTNVVGISPYIKLKDVFSNLSTMVEKGIAANVEQRAFLQTLKNDIAATFDAENSTLLQLVRIQQSDSTAAMLGVESALTTYLNGMFEDTEYLTDVADTVYANIYEAVAKLDTSSGVAFDYEVQKWLGSLYSVGMSSSSVSSIASALGMLGSGDVSGLANNEAMQNLLVMAASNAGLNYADLLADGLDSSSVNTLMKSMISYLSEIASSTDSNVVESEYASIFGLSVSDLTSVTNLSSSVEDIYNSTLDYSGAITELNDAADTIYQRVSVGGMASNIWSNIEYGIAEGIATSPAMYAMWKAASVLQDTVGGISIPSFSVLGTGTDLNTTVADLMKVGVVGTSLLSGIGSLLTSLGSSNAGFSASGMLEALNLNGTGIEEIVRGTGITSTSSGTSVSQSSYVGNSSSSDLYNATVTSATDSANNTLTEAQEESTSVDLDTIDQHLVKISTLLEAVISGTSSFHTVVDDYGLTNWS